jgi:MFS family permease
MPNSPAATDRIERHVWIVAGVVILGMIMSILDTTIVNVALDRLGRDLHSPISQIQWVVTGYLLSLAAVIPITGWAARRQARLPHLDRPVHAHPLCGVAARRSSRRVEAPTSAGPEAAVEPLGA